MIKKAEEKGISEVMGHNTVCLYKTDDSNWCGKLYEETTFKKLLQDIKIIDILCLHKESGSI